MKYQKLFDARWSCVTQVTFNAILKHSGITL